jgi:methanogenic corrinoid protein MtbC1
VLSLYLSGESVAAICDGPVRESMTRIGELWTEGPEGIFVEHRATDLCLQALQQLVQHIEVGPEAPVAMGGAVAGDPFLLPSICTAAVLAEEGFSAINLGADCPAEALLAGVTVYAPALCWLSVSTLMEQPDLKSQLSWLSKELHARGIALVLGGRGLPASGIDELPGVFIGSSMKELVSFTRGLRMAAAR